MYMYIHVHTYISPPVRYVLPLLSLLFVEDMGIVIMRHYMWGWMSADVTLAPLVIMLKVHSLCSHM